MSGRLPTLMTTFAAAALLTAAGALNPRPIMIWNASDSVPLGLYALHPVNRWYVTELVAMRPSDSLATFFGQRGYLPMGLPMLKRILALPGQTVCRREFAILVDNIEVGSAQSHDSRGRLLPDWQGCTVVGDDGIFLMNWQSETSLDGRYFGVVPKASVIGHAVPLWTEEP
jgi:conjugative transfer signal peptidase TraF